MGLTSSMWTGVSGLLVHGEKMNVVGHNIANVNTIGYKSQRMDFQDLFYTNTFSAAGITQIGMGARVGCVLNDFSQGPFESTGLSTDLAIQGKGWFQVRVPSQDTVYYTRAGDFYFNKQGELQNPQGYILQGWKVPLDRGPSIGMGVTPAGAVTSSIIGAGVPTDIRLDTWTVPPLQTSNIAMYCDLSAYSTDNCRWEANPFAAMFNTWDGQLLDPLNNNLPLERNNRPYMPESAFSYQSPIKIYDEAGVAHTVTIYYDKVEKNDATPGTIYYDGGKPSETVWEYIVTINPAEDMRMYCPEDPRTGLPGDPVSIQNTRMAGILMSGTLTFSGSGQLVDQTAYTLMGGHEAVVTNTSTGESTVLHGYKAVWTNPNNPSDTMTFLAGDTISPAQMTNTAFYPIVDISNSVPAAVVAAVSPAVVPVADVLATTVVTGAKQNFPSNRAAAVTYAAGAFYTYTVKPGYEVVIGGNTYTAGMVLTSDPSDPSAADWALLDGAGGDAYCFQPGYEVDANHRVVIPGVGGATYEAGDRITNPLHIAWLDVGSPAADAYCFELQPSVEVNQGYMITGSDGRIYTAGRVLPIGVTAVTADKMIGAQNMMMSWYPTAVSNNGLPLMVANFTSQEQAMTIGSPKGKDYLIEMDLGLKVPNLSNPWKNAYALGEPRPNGSFAPDPATIDPNDPTTWADYSGLAGVNGQPIHQPQATTLVGSKESNTQVSRQNGYTYGNLMDVMVDQHGILSGIYSNGVTLPLYQIVLYDFVAPQHLRFEGGNLVSQTRDSGDPSWSAAGSGGFGVIQSYTIEQSNVDLAKEMVHLITTQRGFQANSKVITTTDTMLDVVVNMKR